MWNSKSRFAIRWISWSQLHGSSLKHNRGFIGFFTFLYLKPKMKPRYFFKHYYCLIVDPPAGSTQGANNLWKARKLHRLYIWEYIWGIFWIYVGYPSLYIPIYSLYSLTGAPHFHPCGTTLFRPLKQFNLPLAGLAYMSTRMYVFLLSCKGVVDVCVGGCGRGCGFYGMLIWPHMIM